MIRSMTAFARVQRQGEWGNAVCELRTVNHRYLDIALRLPEQVALFEMPIREKIQQTIQRGKLECTFRYQAPPLSEKSLQVNLPLASSLCHAIKVIEQLLSRAAPVSPADILRWPGMLETPAVDTDRLQQIFMQLVDECLQALVAARSREGMALQKTILQRLTQVNHEITVIKKSLSAIQLNQRTRLQTRFAEANIPCDTERVEQEIVLCLQKMDVTEELDRLTAHVAEVKRIMTTSDGINGRRLDFLMQELHREANTLGAKSVSVETTRAAVELKVLIEQMREQVQNIE